MEKLLVLALVTAVFCSLPANTVCRDEKHYYRDCKDAYEQGERCSTVYKIRPEIVGSFAAFIYPPFDVYCDMDTDGGGWTVFQRRINGSQDFYLNWTDYVLGFGNVGGEFWLGLHKIHRLTASSPNLRVDLADFDDNWRFARYKAFRVQNLGTKFRMTVSGYSGNAGDGLGLSNNRGFSTKDEDNDGSSTLHCAQRHQGAWWYAACTNSNLNGHYYTGTKTVVEQGINWHSFRGISYSLKVSEMKVRRP